MLDPRTAGLVTKIVNLFADFELPIISREKVFEDVRLVMDSQLVTPIDSPSSVLNLDDLRRENVICQSRCCNYHGCKGK